MDTPHNPGIAALYLEDFIVGKHYRSPAITVTERQIIDYALLYDPQRFHIDAEAGRAHPFGQLFASGLHTVAMSFRLFAESRVLAACAHAGMGIDKLRWVKPVMPGDTLIIRCDLLEPIKRGIAKMRGRAFVGNKLVTESIMIASIVKKNQ